MQIGSDTSEDDSTAQPLGEATQSNSLYESGDEDLPLELDMHTVEEIPDFALNTDPTSAPIPPPVIKRSVQVEEIEDEDSRPRKVWREEYPHDRHAGAPVTERRRPTKFEQYRENQAAQNQPPWAPFASKSEWGLVEWLMRSCNQTARDEYLHLDKVSYKFY